MRAKVHHPRRRRPWRALLLALLVIPFVPELAILLTGALAQLLGCRPEQACLGGALPAGDVITLALRLSAGLMMEADRAGSDVWWWLVYAAFNGWLVLCLAVVTLAWSRTASRLAIGLAVALVFAFLPYAGPALAIAPFTGPHCAPNEGGAGPCQLFGTPIGDKGYSVAHDAVALTVADSGEGARLSLALFAGYATAVVAGGSIRRRRRARAADRPGGAGLPIAGDRKP